MRYELTDHEWMAIRPMLPNKPRGVPRVDDRRVLNGIFWVLRSGAPWRDLPDDFGPYTTCYNRFVRWRRAGVWGRIMNAQAAAHDTSVQMIDTSIVRVHQHGACIIRNRRQSHGTVTRWADQQNTCGGRYQPSAGAACADRREAHDNRLAPAVTRRASIPGVCYLNRRFPELGIEPLALSELVKRAPMYHFEHPQRPTFHLLMLFSAGTTTHYVDFERLRCTAGTLVHVRPGQVLQFVPREDGEAAVLLFTPEFLLPNASWRPPVVFGSVALESGIPTSVINLNSDEYTRVHSGFTAVGDEYRRTDGSNIGTQILQHLLYALLLQIVRCSGRPDEPENSKYQRIVERFLAAIETKFMTTRRVEDYVHRLGCSIKTLRRACLDVRDLPPKALIEQRVVLEAKRLIAHTAWPIKSVARTLGFREPTNFVKFFHHHAKVTPSKFRVQFPGRAPVTRKRQGGREF